MVKDRPILFSAPMVRSILDGRKVQTRRVCKVQPPSTEYELATCVSTTGDKRNQGKQHWILRDGVNVLDSSQPYFSCPYGKTGELLWVKETWLPRCNGTAALYRADYCETEMAGIAGMYSDNGRWRPSIFMPRWASRITLEITGVRVERLNEISEADAISEGLDHVPDGAAAFGVKGLATSWRNDPREAFRALWQSINGPDSWDANPWVWVLEFRRVG